MKYILTGEYFEGVAQYKWGSLPFKGIISLIHLWVYPCILSHRGIYAVFQVWFEMCVAQTVLQWSSFTDDT